MDRLDRAIAYTFFTGTQDSLSDFSTSSRSPRTAHERVSIKSFVRLRLRRIQILKLRWQSACFLPTELAPFIGDSQSSGLLSADGRVEGGTYGPK